MNTEPRTYFDNILSHYESIRTLQAGDLCLPRFATLHLSNRCNHRCGGCAYAGKLDGAMMEREDAFRLISMLVKAGVRGFEFCGGGEPLILPYLPELLAYLADNGCSFGCLTNGSLLREELQDLFVRYGTYIRMSLEASNFQEYTYYTGTSTAEWERVVGNIRDLCRKRDEHESDLDIGIKFAVGKSMRGFRHYRDGIDLAASLKVSNVQFKALSHEPEELSEEEWRQECVLLSTMEPSSPIPILNGLGRQGPAPQCWLNPLHTVVDHQGDTYLCCYYYWREDTHRIGNFLRDGFDAVWFSEHHRELIRQINWRECDKVNCKFFRHHRLVEDAFRGGRIEFL